MLNDLVAALADGRIEVVDLTSPLSASTPIIQLPPEFGQTARFELEEISRYDDRGPAWYWNNFRSGEHTGTHFDAPVHWVTGRDKGDVSSVPAVRLVASAAVLDFTAEAAADPDFLLEVEHVTAWEGAHGALPVGGWLLYRTGWDARSASQEQFLNADERGPHTPGMSAECARWLAEESSVMGIGVETVGTDAGAAHSFTPAFPCHSYLLANDKYGLTQLQNLSRLPPTGAVVIAAPLPIVGGSGSPARVLALVERGMNVAEAVGTALGHAGLDHVFGVVGSGNFHVTNAMVAAGARFVAARHECGAAVMADGFVRVSGRPAAVSVHQGCGLTNAMTGIAEAAKSRTPLVVLAAEVTERRSNFFVDQTALATAVGAVPLRVTSAATAVDDAVAALATARDQRRTVVLNLPLPVQAAPFEGTLDVSLPPCPPSVEPSAAEVVRLVAALRAAERPVFIAGRGARAARAELAVLADRCGALLATSAVAKGLFRGDPFDLDVSGGFASPLAAELIGGADLIVGWGCALNMWTMRHGRLIASGAVVVQVDDTPEAIGVHRDVTFGVVGDVRATAAGALAVLDDARPLRWRTDDVRRRLAAGVRWQDVPFVDESGGGRVDPRALTIALDELLPEERIVSVDSGNFMGYPSMFLSVPDEQGFCFTQAFQSIGLGLATAIGAGLARPDRLPVAAVGDGGGLMAAAELDTIARLGLPMIVIVYNDDAYGAEVHHFGPDGFPLDTVTFPSTDVAAIARGYGFTGVTVTSVEDLAPVAAWLRGDRDTPLLIDAKVTRDHGSWWLEEAFRGH